VLLLFLSRYLKFSPPPPQAFDEGLQAGAVSAKKEEAAREKERLEREFAEAVRLGLIPPPPHALGSLSSMGSFSMRGGVIEGLGGGGAEGVGLLRAGSVAPRASGGTGGFGTGGGAFGGGGGAGGAGMQLVEALKATCAREAALKDQLASLEGECAALKERYLFFKFLVS
jgi:hypothetical protein